MSNRTIVDDFIDSVKSEQYQSLIEVIKDSGAYENMFFDKCDSGLSKDELKTYIKNWYPITETFSKYGLLYTYNIVSYMSNIEYGSSDYEKYEKYFCEVLKISSGEFKISIIDPKEFHPRTFTRLAPKLDLEINDIVNRKFELKPETKELDVLIKENFESRLGVLSGFANYFVIETIAYNIVKSMDNTFGKLKNKSGEKFYSGDELIYIKEHLTLEEDHCKEVQGMLDILDLDNNDFECLKIDVKKLAEKFGKFWNSL